MKISHTPTTIADLVPGDYFRYKRRTYLRIDARLAAADVQTGTVCSFAPETPIRRVKANLTTEE